MKKKTTLFGWERAFGNWKPRSGRSTRRPEPHRARTGGPKGRGTQRSHRTTGCCAAADCRLLERSLNAKIEAQKTRSRSEEVRNARACKKKKKESAHLKASHGGTPIFPIATGVFSVFFFFSLSFLLPTASHEDVPKTSLREKENAWRGVVVPRYYHTRAAGL